MTELDPVAYLRAKGYDGRPAAGPEVVYPCFFDCEEPPDSRKRKLYVNSVEGFYHCKVCDAAGGTTLLQRHFGDEVACLPGTDPGVRRRLLNAAAELGAQMLTANDDVALWLLRERGLSPGTIIERRLGWVGRPWSLTGGLEATPEELATTGLVSGDRDFFHNHVLIPYVSRGQVVQIRGKVLGGRYFTGPGEYVRLFNADALTDAEDVILTEGEFDCMALAQHLALAPDDRVRRFGVVGIAGAGALPEGFADYFRHAKRVHIGLDPDDAGRRAAVKIKERLGTRARIVELPEELPKCDWTEYLLPRSDAHPHGGHTWRDVMDLVGTAAGKRLFSVREAGARYRQGREAGVGLKTGFAQLDSTILPGILPGQLVVLLAKTGVGKSVWLCNVAYATRGVPTLFLTLEMTQEEIYDRLRRVYLFHHPHASDHDFEEAFADLRICDENRLVDGDLSTLIEEYEIETGIRPEQVIVDYLGYYARGIKGRSPYEKTSDAVMQLKAEAKTHRVAIIAPHQVNRLSTAGRPVSSDGARDSGVVEETADFLLSIWRPDDALRTEEAAPSGKLKLELIKSRHGGSGRTFTLQMDLLTLAIVDDHSKEAKQAAHHSYLYWRGTTYEQLRREQTRPVQLAMRSGAA